jgi:hypothetical protein
MGVRNQQGKAGGDGFESCAHGGGGGRFGAFGFFFSFILDSDEWISDAFADRKQCINRGLGRKHLLGGFSVERGYFSAMSKIEEIEQAVEQLPLKDFAKLAVWVDQRRRQLEIIQPAADTCQVVVRDHSAFLNSYAPQDEGLYDDAAAR